jgi:hypothetical protein
MGETSKYEEAKKRTTTTDTMRENPTPSPHEGLPLWTTKTSKAYNNTKETSGQDLQRSTPRKQGYKGD